MAVGDPPSASTDSHQHRQKRARSQLSCMPCRVGKLKCNRERDPACDQCVRRNRQSACQYVPPPAKAKPVTNVKGRIRQLENLVKDLMVQQDHKTTSSTSGPNDQHTPPSDNDNGINRSIWSKRMDSNVETSLGDLNISGSQVAYTGENHWQTILMSLSDIQKDLGEDDGDVYDGPDERPHPVEPATTSSATAAPISQPGFLLGQTKRMTREELVAQVPDKKTCDRLLSLWFNSPEPFKIIIHAPTFQDEYRRFQRDQSVSTMWLGLLFSILCLAESFGLRNHQPGAPEDTACVMRVELYQSLTASAAVLAEYTKPKEYTIECLLLYMVGLRSENAAMNAWLVMGIVVRLALRMGYHRDPGHYPKISAFDAEMRRRIWTMAHMIDVLMSFLLGLPSMVRTVASDTQPPQNLLDRDFSRTMSFLPVARGEHELTPSLYVRSKLRIIHVFAEAAELSHATIPPSFETIERLNADLETAKAELPAALQMPDMSEVVTDPAEQLMCRFNIDLLYQKCKIVLFRRYMLVPLSELSPEDQLKGIGACRKSCIDSARRVLDHHHTIFQAIQPGGQLEHMRWYMGSIAVHDFLLAAMVVCLELSQQLQRDKMLRISGGMNCPTRQAMLKALQQSYDIWNNTAQEVSSALGVNSALHNNDASGHKGGDMHEETAKASKAMAAMLARIKAQSTGTSDEETSQMPGPRQNLFQAKPGTYFDEIGLTPTSARRLDTQSNMPYRGVVVRHDWEGVPDDIELGKITPNSTAYGESATTHQSALRSQELDAMLDASLVQAGFDDGDAMNLDWQAFDNEIFNTNNNIANWTQQDYDLVQMTDAQTPTAVPITGTNDQFATPTVPDNLKGLNFTMEDVAGFDFGSNSVYTPFIENEKNAAWMRSPRP